MCVCMLMHGTMNHEGHQRTAPASDYKCAHCGFLLQAGYAFCPSCGMSLRAVEKCPACGQKVDSSWATCAYCGSPLNETHEHTAHR